MTEPGAQRPAVNERLFRGTLYRRVPNTTLQWSRTRNRPTKLAFRPDTDPATQEPERDTSMYLASLTRPETVREGHEGYAVCAIDIERMLAAASLKREPITVRYDPVHPSTHPADHAHCAVENLNGPMQKLLAKRDDLAAVALPPGDLVDRPTPSDSDD